MFLRTDGAATFIQSYTGFQNETIITIKSSYLKSNNKSYLIDQQSHLLETKQDNKTQDDQ